MGKGERCRLLRLSAATPRRRRCRRCRCFGPLCLRGSRLSVFFCSLIHARRTPGCPPCLLAPRGASPGVGERGRQERESLRLRVLVAHECAIAAFPLTSFLWCSLGSFAESSFPEDPALAASVYSRALRNCPWVGELWARALRAAERRGEKKGEEEDENGSSSSSDEEFDALFRAAMSAPISTAEEFVECILARLDRMRRKAQMTRSDGEKEKLLQELRSAFREASQWLSAGLPALGGPGPEARLLPAAVRAGIGGR